MKWDEMPSEEKDRWIADKVLGYDLGLFPDGTWEMWDGSGLTQAIPRYTESMDAAWQVVEKMKGLHHPLPIDASKQDLTIADIFLVRLWEAIDRRGIDALFEYSPEIICKAALQA